MGRVSADYYVQDGVVPRTKLPEVLRRIAELGGRARPAGRQTSSTPATATCTRSCSTTRGSTARPSGRRSVAEAILEICIDAGGSLTGEHGIGIDKVCSMPLLFGSDDLEAMKRLRARVRPGRALQPRQGDPDAAALRRGAGAVPRSSAGEGRACRASLRSPRCLRAAAADGTRVSIGREGGDVVLSTAGLDQVLEHEAGDLTCIVEAGVRVRDLNARLAEHGQMLALDPPGNPTIGACLAANLSGPRRHRYGAVRDLVIGITVVLGDGTVASSGGKVVKNVAGYDLAKLFCGSEGRFGLIARVALRLHPRPETSRTLVAAGDAAAKARTILRSPLEASAVDVLWPGRLAVLIEGSRAAVDAQFAKAQALVGGEDDRGRSGRRPRRSGSGARAAVVRAGRARACARRGGRSAVLRVRRCRASASVRTRATRPSSRCSSAYARSSIRRACSREARARPGRRCSLAGCGSREGRLVAAGEPTLGLAALWCTGRRCATWTSPPRRSQIRPRRRRCEACR